jgi:hypothetical protein
MQRRKLLKVSPGRRETIKEYVRRVGEMVKKESAIRIVENSGRNVDNFNDCTLANNSTARKSDNRHLTATNPNHKLTLKVSSSNNNNITLIKLEHSVDSLLSGSPNQNQDKFLRPDGLQGWQQQDTVNDDSSDYRDTKIVHQTMSLSDKQQTH